MEKNIQPIGGFPSIIPKDLYNEIINDLKRGKSSDEPKTSLSIGKILESSTKNTHFLFGGEEKISIV
jgi:hypothetical protein